MPKKSTYSERDLLRVLRRAKKILGDKFSRDNYRTLEGFPNEYVIRKHFGSWSSAVQHLEQHYPEFASSEEKQILLYLKKAKNILGENFTRDNYRLLKGFPSVHKIVSLYGSWSNAVSQLDN